MTQIFIEVVSVGAPQTIPTKNGKSYQAIEIAYKKDGKIEGKKIMSFVAPAVFKAVQNLSPGESVIVTTEKNEAGYWQWTEVGDSGHSPSPTSASTDSPSATKGSGAKSSGGNWETKEERAARQVMIVRQSSLSSAVALSAATGDKKATATDIINIAKQFEGYVLDTVAEKQAATSVVGFEDFADDIPL